MSDPVLDKKIIENLAKVEEKGKIYENLSVKYDPHYASAMRAIPIIKKFIKDRGLIIYGGTAIDYALRLHGDNIYPDEMLDIPDLDFYSPNSVDDAYDLAAILYRAGYTSSRAIVATYVITMRVDIIDNHFLADISYVPPELFKKLPYKTYDGMKIIDPVFQKIDLHSSLSFPFDNPPREVVFARWRKDIARFNLLHKYYPTPAPQGTVLKPAGAEFKYMPDMVLSGFAAYGVISRALRVIAEKTKSKVTIKPDIGFKITNGSIKFDTHEDTLHLVHMNLNDAVEAFKIINVKKYASYINIMRKHIEGEIKSKETLSTIGNKLKVHVISTTDSYISVHKIEIDGVLITTVCIQFLLMQFLVLAHIATGDLKKTYYAYYDGLLHIINTAEQILGKMPNNDQAKDIIMNSPFFPTVKVYGNDNLSPAYKLGYQRALSDLGEDIEFVPTPPGFYPARGHPKPVFKYEESSYFIKDGRELKSETI